MSEKTRVRNIAGDNTELIFTVVHVAGLSLSKIMASSSHTKMADMQQISDNFSE